VCACYGDRVPALLLALALAFAVPALAVAGSWVWARWLARRMPAPRFVSRVAYALAGLSTLVLVLGVAYGARALTVPATLAATEKARALAEAISEAMNASAFAGLMTLATFAWLLVFTLRARRGS
jgi:hypothetical protein